MKTEGLLTEAEFSAAKARILGLPVAPNTEADMEAEEELQKKRTAKFGDTKPPKKQKIEDEKTGVVEEIVV